MEFKRGNEVIKYCDFCEHKTYIPKAEYEYRDNHGLYFNLCNVCAFEVKSRRSVELEIGLETLEVKWWKKH